MVTMETEWMVDRQIKNLTHHLNGGTDEETKKDQSLTWEELKGFKKNKKSERCRMTTRFTMLCASNQYRTGRK